jgi:hypothetical protein
MVGVCGGLLVTFEQQLEFIGAGARLAGNKSPAIRVIPFRPAIRAIGFADEYGPPMSDDNNLLDHARRYFSQAGHSTDPKKMRLLAELGLEFIKLAHEDAVLTARATSAKQRGQAAE